MAWWEPMKEQLCVREGVHPRVWYGRTKRGKESVPNRWCCISLPKLALWFQRLFAFCHAASACTFSCQFYAKISPTAAVPVPLSIACKSRGPDAARQGRRYISVR